jgi:hypothetical protein
MMFCFLRTQSQVASAAICALSTPQFGSTFFTKLCAPSLHSFKVELADLYSFAPNGKSIVVPIKNLHLSPGLAACFEKQKASLLTAPPLAYRALILPIRSTLSSYLSLLYTREFLSDPVPTFKPSISICGNHVVAAVRCPAPPTNILLITLFFQDADPGAFTLVSTHQCITSRRGDECKIDILSARRNWPHGQALRILGPTKGA